MTWFPDLSPYTYGPERVAGYELEYTPADRAILNVGWLASGHDFPVGEPPGGLVDALAELRAEHGQMRTRGWHECEFCDRMDIRTLSAEDREERQSRIGNAEIRVIAENGTILTAPTLVAHYVERHRYLPPAEFIEAVLARRIVPEVGE